jgi:DNA-binding FadR family transcriptional regulator
VHFRKVRTKKVATIVAEQIIQTIKDGSFTVGSKLPSEFELAERMGVSRPTIREALSALTAVGLIESRPGSGNFVRNGASTIDTIGKEAVLVLETESSCIEIMEARGLFEPPVAGLAAKKRTDEDVVNLRSLYDKLAQLAEKGDFDPYFAMDKHVHLAIVAASHNTLVAGALIPLVNTMDQKVYREFTQDYYFKNKLGLEDVALLHDELIQAIIDQNSSLAVQKMREHWMRMQEAVSSK